MFTYVDIYFNMQIYVYIYIYIYINVYIHFLIYPVARLEYVSVIYRYTKLYVYIYICIYIRRYVYVDSLRRPTYIQICMCISRTCICSSLCISALHTDIHTYICICKYICICFVKVTLPPT